MVAALGSPVVTHTGLYRRGANLPELLDRRQHGVEGVLRRLDLRILTRRGAEGDAGGGDADREVAGHAPALRRLQGDHQFHGGAVGQHQRDGGGPDQARPGVEEPRLLLHRHELPTAHAEEPRRHEGLARALVDLVLGHLSLLVMWV